MPVFEEDTPRWVRLVIVAAIATVVALVLAVVLVVAMLQGDVDVPRAERDEPAASSGGASSSVCGLEDGDQSMPTAAPDAEWDLIHGFAVPRSAMYGPGVISDDGTERSCFARSPLGAVFFLLNLPASVDMDQSGGENVGFRVLAYTGDTATVEYAGRLTEGPYSGTLGAAAFELEWADGDWRLADGWEDVEPVALASLTGYVEFSAGGAW